jgi:hypothetical protein
LTGGGYGTTLNLVLSRASEDVFNSQVAAFSYQVSKIYAVRTLASDVKNLEAISQRMTAFNSRAASELKKLPPLEERFRSQTQAMTTALAKQRSIIPTDRSAAIRGQIGVAINQAGVEFNQAHVEYQSSRTAFESTRAGLLKQADALYQKCQSPNGLIDKNSESAKTWGSSCVKLPSVVSEFKTQTSQMLSAFAHADAVWEDESRKQQTIIKSSDVASR